MPTEGVARVEGGDGGATIDGSSNLFKLRFRAKLQWTAAPTELRCFIAFQYRLSLSPFAYAPPTPVSPIASKRSKGLR